MLGRMMVLKRNLVYVAAGAVFLSIAGSWEASAQVAEEACFTDMANAARASGGAAVLATNQDLVEVARRHSQRMADSGRIFPNSNLSQEAPNGWQHLGQNVAQGSSCDSIHQGFMRSDPNFILDPRFNFIGTGVVISNGTLFVTEVFMQAGSASSPTPQPSLPKPSPTPKPPAAAASPTSPPAAASPTLSASPTVLAPPSPIPSLSPSAPASPTVSEEPPPSSQAAGPSGRVVLAGLAAVLTAFAMIISYLVLGRR